MMKKGEIQPKHNYWVSPFFLELFYFCTASLINTILIFCKHLIFIYITVNLLSILISNISY